MPSDVYLTYSIFILTATRRFVAFGLNLRTEIIQSVSSKDAAKDVSLLPPIPDSDSGPPYTSTLQARPFSPPSILSRPLGLPSIAQLAVPMPQNVHGELRVTPETLRYLTAVVEKISSEIHEVKIAFASLMQRHDQQRQEYLRQQEKCKDLRIRLGALASSSQNGIQSTLKRTHDEQSLLLSRMDRVLQAMINKASPELNEHETRWFDELQRMKAQVLGLGRYDQMSLKHRIQMVWHLISVYYARL